MRAAVQREVDALDPQARALLRGAAIAGDPFDPELAAAAAAVTSDGSLGLSFSDPSLVLDALVAADLVRPHGGARRFAFRHPLVRRAVYDATPPPGGSRPTNAWPPRSTSAGRAPPCAPTTSRASPARATARRSTS